MRVTQKQAFEIMLRNMRTYGGDWEVILTNDLQGNERLVIRMIGSDGPTVWEHAKRLFSTLPNAAHKWYIGASE